MLLLNLANPLFAAHVILQSFSSKRRWFLLCARVSVPFRVKEGSSKADNIVNRLGVTIVQAVNSLWLPQEIHLSSTFIIIIKKIQQNGKIIIQSKIKNKKI